MSLGCGWVAASFSDVLVNVLGGNSVRSVQHVIPSRRDSARMVVSTDCST
jgi:hypothetical protein